MSPFLSCTIWPLSITFIHLLIPLLSFAYNYEEVKTPHFSFYFDSRDKRIVRSLKGLAERYRREIVDDLGVDYKGKTRVYISPSLKEYQGIQPGGGAPLWSVGVAYPDVNLIVIKSPRSIKKGHIDIGKVFRHELTHIALGRAFKGSENIPRWLHEGLAMYTSREWSISRVSTMTKAVLTNSLIPLAEITYHFPREEDRAELAYSESFYLISFLISQYGREGFHRFVREYSSGEGLRKSLFNVYGLTWRILEERWKNYLRLRFSFIPVFTSATTLWFFVSILFIIGYLKKRKASRIKLKEWEMEDRLYG